ncbi:MaoC family dehydratase [Burkholderia sp. FERM BP-3421]|jgi:acyl dehydratase|uniref:MaoC family dehydratase n=1 Tax=Burkholderia sp. FERM BP-3421 TaxID=1494466 RepID=UPI002361F736|nr:MaoC family dehydratase [Burkholderia sp. FERM BP-3421]WDD94708.1 MaoC family dehydratase [Burkholderia sp. FERM BP-3421]
MTSEAAAAAPLIDSAPALHARVGAERAVSGWRVIDEARVERFADATDDHQWIHVDPVRAVRESPFGGPIAHGFLTLSLIPALLGDALRFEQRMGVNYGLNRVRFLRPVPVGARVRAACMLKAAEDVANDGVRATWSISVEIEAQGQPALACVAEFITQHHF